MFDKIKYILEDYVGYEPEELGLKNYDDLRSELARKIEQLILSGVNNQKELLISYEAWKGTCLGGNTWNIDEFLKEKATN